MFFVQLVYRDPHKECGHLLMVTSNAFFVFFLHSSAYQSCFGPLERLWSCVRAEREWTHRVGVFSIYINLQIGHSSSKCPSFLAFIRASQICREDCAPSLHSLILYVSSLLERVRKLLFGWKWSNYTFFLSATANWRRIQIARQLMGPSIDASCRLWCLLAVIHSKRTKFLFCLDSVRTAH